MQSWDALRRPIWLFDPHGLRGLYANAAALRLWGADSLDELLSRDFSKLSRAVHARTARLAQATAHGEEVTEQWTFYPNGEPVTVQATISTCRLDDGSPVLLFEAAAADVEAGERRAVEALRHTSTLITLFDRDGRAIFANPAAFSAYGSTEHPFEARFADPERGRPMLIHALAGETVAEVCETLTTSGRRWHHLDARPVLDPVTGEAGVLLNERDVTERVEAELAWAAAEQKAAMAEARQKFLTDMSHELRTPLNTVIGFSELLKDDGLSPEQAQQAHRIHDAGRRLLAVVNEMIGLSERDGWTGDAAPSSARFEPRAAPGARTAEAPGERALRVLYVDDNESNRALVTAILTAHGVDCQTADDGRQGLEAARAGGWDLILMDIQMPVMNGIEATRAIRALSGPVGAVPIVAVTANTLTPQLQDYAEAGMDDVIPKPVDMAELVAKVFAWSEAGRTPQDAGAEDGRAASR
ncbi:response regulator [Phenylobacterium sp.]|uniref:response regulator n=1 Tax=Phenylobacterium sp. TaxID=1871053 RepID=UPI00356AB5C2